MDKVLEVVVALQKYPMMLKLQFNLLQGQNFLPRQVLKVVMVGCFLIWINEALDGAKLLLMLTEKVSPALNQHCRGQQLGVSGGWDLLLHLPKDP